MKKLDLFSITISAIICLIVYLTSNNIFVSLGVMVVYILYYFLLARKKILNYVDELERAHGCFHFINGFMVTMSTKESLDEAFQSGVRNPSKSLQEMVEQMKDMSSIEKVKYLMKYFHFSVYHMFINVVDIYLEQGGDIFKIGDTLYQESSRIEETLNESVSVSKKKLAEFAILWSLAIVVILFMRFALHDFYFKMLKSIIFMILLVVFFLIILASIHIFIVKYSSLPIQKEEVKDE